MPWVASTTVCDMKIEDSMKTRQKQKGSVMIMAIFVIALLSALVSGMLQINTEEILLMQNQVDASKAMAVAEAGLNDAFAQIRQDDGWKAGFKNKAFASHSYSVDVSTSPLTVESTGTLAQGFVAKIVAEIVVSGASPHTISITSLRINE